MPKTTDVRARAKGQKLFVDVKGSMNHSSLGGNSYVLIFVDHHTRFKVERFTKNNNDTTAALSSMIADYISPPRRCLFECIRTDNGGEFKEDFQRELAGRGSLRTKIPHQTRQSRSTNGGGEMLKHLSPFWEGTAQKYPLPGTYLTNSL